jgi:hypothetical protein
MSWLGGGGAPRDVIESAQQRFAGETTPVFVTVTGGPVGKGPDVKLMDYIRAVEDAGWLFQSMTFTPDGKHTVLAFRRPGV